MIFSYFPRFPAESETRLVLAGTIQFSSSLSQARDRLSTVYPSLKVRLHTSI